MMPARGSRAFRVPLPCLLICPRFKATILGRTKMKPVIREEVKDDLLSRGYSRRQMVRAAMMFGGAATALTLSPEIAFAADTKRGGVRIGQNECWTGPMAPGAAAAAAVISQSNRYVPNNEHDD